MHGSKSAILAIFQTGRDGRALLVQPLRIPHRISKILFALGVDELLAVQEGKIREPHFFKVQFGKITVCSVFAFILPSSIMLTSIACYICNLCIVLEFIIPIQIS